MYCECCDKYMDVKRGRTRCPFLDIDKFPLRRKNTYKIKTDACKKQQRAVSKWSRSWSELSSELKTCDYAGRDLT